MTDNPEIESTGSGSLSRSSILTLHKAMLLEVPTAATSQCVAGSYCFERLENATHLVATHSMRKARTGSMNAARRAGMMLEMAAVSTSTPMAMVMTGTFTLVIS